MTDYTVKQGDCLSSIAHEFGFTWQKLWNDSANADLRSLRKNPNVLYPGDIVRIPTVKELSFALKSNAWNRFVINRERAELRLTLQINGAPLAGVAYSVTVDGGEPSTGTTDGEGKLRIAVAPDARLAELRLEEALVYTVRLGGLDPVATVTGLQSRLAALGFYCGAIDGAFGPLTRSALRIFQSASGLTVTGESDDATQSALASAFGC